jgi:NTE family protein
MTAAGQGTTIRALPEEPMRNGKKVAIVLSGGGIRGPLQVGALESLLEHGVEPDMVVGTSAGALNAGFMAAHGPDLYSIPCLKDAWRSATRDVVYPGNIFSIAGRLVQGDDGLFPTEGMRRLIQSHLPDGVRMFGQLKSECYLTTVDLISRKLFVFGDFPRAPLIEGMMASSVIPVLQPPVLYASKQLVDGGVLAEVPCSVAMDRGAQVIYAVNLGAGEAPGAPVKGVFNIFMRTIETMLIQGFLQDMRRAEEDPLIELHHIQINAFADLEFNDFDHIEEQFVAGKETTDLYLSNPQPREVLAPEPMETPRLEEVAGMREYVPPYMR